MNDIEEWSASTLKLIHERTESGDPDVRLGPNDFPDLAPVFTSRGMVLAQGWQAYDSLAVERVMWSGTKASFGGLGVALLTACFTGEGFDLELLDAESEVRMLRIDGASMTSVEPHLRVEARPVSVTYLHQANLDEFPWGSQEPLHGLPCLRLASRDDELATFLEGRPRDCLLLESGLQGTIRLGFLLLDLGHPNNRQPVVTLESELGWRGVGLRSIEARFFLPELPEMRERVRFTGPFPGMPEEWLAR